MRRVRLLLMVIFATAVWARPALSLQETEITMTDGEFWALIGQTSIYEGHPEQQLLALESTLQQRPAAEVAAFDAAFGRQVKRAYRWDLWGALLVAEGGASDDAFLYFRIWLVSKGRKAFEVVLDHPDDLADLDFAPGPGGYYEFEEFGYVARQVLASKQGGDPGGLPGDNTGGPAPTGPTFNDDPASLKAAYPKLWRKFSQHPLGGG